MGPELEIEFKGKIWKWQGPAPFYFVTVPDSESGEVKKVSKEVSYGWGMVPVKVVIGETEWKTTLFPQGDKYVVPIKKEVRKAEGLGEGDEVVIRLVVIS